MIPFIAAMLALGAPLSRGHGVLAGLAADGPGDVPDHGGHAGLSVRDCQDGRGGRDRPGRRNDRKILRAQHAVRRSAEGAAEKGVLRVELRDRSVSPETRMGVLGRRRAAQTSSRETVLENALFLGKWLLLAYLIEALMLHYIPADDVAARFWAATGSCRSCWAPSSGAPAYLNGYAAVPLVDALLEQGMSNGAAMSFVIAGGVSCIPAAIAVWALVKPRVFAAYIGIAMVGAVRRVLSGTSRPEHRHMQATGCRWPPVVLSPPGAAMSEIRMYRVWNFVTNYSVLLIGGALLALVWANTDPNSYHDFVEFVLVDDFIIGHAIIDADGQVHRTLTLHYLVNDVLMAFFFRDRGQGSVGGGDPEERRVAWQQGGDTPDCDAGRHDWHRSPCIWGWRRFWDRTSLTRCSAAGRFRPPRISRFPIWSGGSSSGPGTLRCGFCCCWRLPTMRRG